MACGPGSWVLAYKSSLVYSECAASHKLSPSVLLADRASGLQFADWEAQCSSSTPLDELRDHSTVVPRNVVISSCFTTRLNIPAAPALAPPPMITETPFLVPHSALHPPPQAGPVIASYVRSLLLLVEGFISYRMSYTRLAGL